MVRPISIQADPPRGARGLRQWIYAFATALIAAVIALPVAQPVAAGADVPSGTLSTYTYDHSHHTAALQHATTERGPPAEYNRHTSYDAVDRWSHGTSVRPYGPTTPATSANPTPTAIAHGALATTATRGQVEVANVRLCDLRGARVAAETGGSGVLRHYTTREAAESISKEGVLRPGGSGKTWLTPDKYANGADARSGLALNKTPDGYYEIPMCRVKCPSGPSTVEPYYGQPGGGTEITTEFPIDVRNLVFNLFGG